jgi:hypothetical protein
MSTLETLIQQVVKLIIPTFYVALLIHDEDYGSHSNVQLLSFKRSSPASILEQKIRKDIKTSDGFAYGT